MELDGSLSNRVETFHSRLDRGHPLQSSPQICDPLDEYPNETTYSEAQWVSLGSQNGTQAVVRYEARDHHAHSRIQTDSLAQKFDWIINSKFSNLEW